MNKKIVLFLFLFSIIGGLYSQTTIIESKGHADFTKAIFIELNSGFHFTKPIGYGDVMEIGSKQKYDSLFEHEHHTVWLIFESKQSCFLEFDLLPSKPTDDYDFMLYELVDTTKNYFRNNNLLLRTNISRNIVSQKGYTGLKNGISDLYIKAGPGNPYSSGITVHKGKKYILVIDNVYGTGDGFHLNFKKSDCVIEKPKSKLCAIDVKIVEKTSKKPIHASCLILETDLLGYPKDTILNKDVFHEYIDVEALKSYQIIAYRKGYLRMRVDIQCDTMKSVNTILIELDSLYIGKKISIENLYFNGGSAQFLRKSFPVLKQLLVILKDNPEIVIDIQGHVNDPYNSSDRKSAQYNQDLSDARCKAVVDYLVKRGINKDRLSYHGFGNSKMLYPYAQNEFEMERNRRVEMEILTF